MEGRVRDVAAVVVIDVRPTRRAELATCRREAIAADPATAIETITISATIDVDTPLGVRVA